MVDRTAVDYVEDPHTAGRLFLELKRQAVDPALSTGQKTETKAALNKLLKTWPEADEVAATASDDELGGLGAGLKQTRNTHRQQRGHTAQSARAARSRSHKTSTASAAKKPAATRGGATPPGAPSSSPPKKTARRGSRKSGVGSDVVAAAAGPAGSWGSFTVQVLGATVFFAVVYALLSNANDAPKGKAAVELVASSVRRGIDVFIRPTDPLAPSAGTTTAGAAGGPVGGAATAAKKVVGQVAAAQVPAIPSNKK